MVFAPLIGGARQCLVGPALRGQERSEATSRGPWGGLGGREGICTSILPATRGLHVISASIFVSVLALVVVACAALAWTIWSRHTHTLNLRLATMQNNLSLCMRRLAEQQRINSELKSTVPSALAAEVADLREAVAKLRDTQRRFQGRFDARMGGALPGDSTGRESPSPYANGLDPEIAAEIAFQTAPPAGP